MEAHTRHTAKPVVQDLLASPEAFDFFQAVRVLNGNIQFKVNPELNFPSASILKVLKTPSVENQYELFVTFMGLFGQQGVLPSHFSTLILERLQAKDTHLAEFLDIFNHRMIELSYQIWAKNRLYVTPTEKLPSNSLAHLLAAFTGVSPRHYSEKDDMRLYYAGLYGRASRSTEGLKTVLEDYFQMPIQIQAFSGHWVKMTETEKTRLSTRQPSALGVNGVLGGQLWSVQNRFTLIVGPVSYEQFQRLLPNGEMLLALRKTVENFVGFEYQFGINILMSAPNIPTFQLERQKAEQRLGWNIWLKTQHAPKGMVRVCFGNASIQHQGVME